MIKRVLVLLLFLFQFSLLVGNLKQNENEQDSTSIKKNEWQTGFRLDYNSVIESILIQYDSQPEYVKRFNIYRSYVFSPVGFQARVRYFFRPEIASEAGLGMVMSGSLLSSYTLCLNGYFFPFAGDFYLVSGLEISKHSSMEEIFGQQPGYRPNPQVLRHLYSSDFYFSVCLGVGYRFGETVSADFTVLKTLNEKYGYYIVSENTSRYIISNGEYPLEVHWKFRLGINFYF